jgi:hypothetical protein
VLIPEQQGALGAADPDEGGTGPTEYYAWQVLDGGEWATLASAVPLVAPDPIPLATPWRIIAEHWRPLAEAHAAASGKQARLAHFRLEGGTVVIPLIILETIDSCSEQDGDAKDAEAVVPTATSSSSWRMERNRADSGPLSAA